ncbi:MAG: transglutaminase-like cysteine peptidase, partial [Pseudomonadota bacterium]|nr:transglutaminase-like cysteine peptidase [Pseudomonadota bacterium]
MRRYSTGILKGGYAALAAIFLVAAICAPSAAGERALFVSLSGSARAPIGWIEFCSQHFEDCAPAPNNGRDAALNANAW